MRALRHGEPRPDFEASAPCYHRGMYQDFSHESTNVRKRIAFISCFRVFVAALLSVATLLAAPSAPPLDRAAARWVEQTLTRMTLDEKIGQLLVTSLNA